MTPGTASGPVVEKGVVNAKAGTVKVAETAAGKSGAPAPPARKPASAKEVIPFEWKLIGESYGVALTLFKAIERADVEAQLGRVDREGYYRNLRILEANEKVKQPAGGDARSMALVGAKTDTRTKAVAKKRKSTAAAKKREAPARIPGAAPRTTEKTAKGTKASKAAKTSKVVRVAKSTKAPKAAQKVKPAKKVKAKKPSKSAKPAKPKATKATKKATKKAIRKKTTPAKSTKKPKAKKKKR